MLTDKQRIAVLKIALRLAADELALSNDSKYYGCRSEEIYLMLIDDAKDSLNINK